MTKDVSIVNKHFHDINPLSFGYEKCRKSHSFGPAIREYYLIHYIKEGKGIIINKNGTHTAKKGDIFIIKPHQVNTYTADKNEPWEYIWIGFDGELAKRLNLIEETVVSFPEITFFEMLECENIQSTKSEFLTSKIFMILSILFSNEKGKNDYVKQVSDYIDTNYMNEIYVEDISKLIKLDRRYLCRIFKISTGITIKQYIINIRIKKAKELLKAGFSISDASSMTGYTDSFNFSKMFKKICGISPFKYKKSL